MPTTKHLISASIALAITFTTAVARASAADDARVHFQAVASGDVPALMRDYADHAQFQWVGGPLDGAYSSPRTSFSRARARSRSDMY